MEKINLLIGLLSDREVNLLKNRARIYELWEIARILSKEEYKRAILPIHDGTTESSPVGSKDSD